mmetsp:Transcript_41370/g.119014  ORF Transcript_41370/g.119014 Transcript_41370/m.119014 type:complete len:699 (+) Transcript_41370:42-2138(+)
MPDLEEITLSAGMPPSSPAPDAAAPTDPSGRAGRQDQGSLLVLVQDAVRAEVRQLQKHLHSEFQEVLAAIQSKPPVQKLMVPQSSGHSSIAAFGSHSPATDLPLPHAWVGRSMRTYAAQEELAAASDDGFSREHERRPPALMPDHVPNGKQTVARAFRRAGTLTSLAMAAQRRRKADEIGDDDADEKPEMTVATSIVPVNPPRRAWGNGGHAGGMSNAGSNASSLTIADPPAESEMKVGDDADDQRRADPQDVPEPIMPTASHLSYMSSESARTPWRVFQVRPRTGSMMSSFSWQKRPTAREVAARLVRSIYFENLTVLFILFNTIMIGIETDYSARNLEESGAYKEVDIVVAVFFILELGLRLFVYRLKFFTMTGWRWNALDVTVVALQLLEQLAVLANIGDSSIPIPLSLMRLLRILRLIRIIRAIRLLRYMNDLRTIVLSVTSSMKPLLSTIVLLALVVYIMAVYFTQLTLHYRIDNRGSDRDGVEELELYFGSVGAASMSLFQTVTGGLEWRSMMDPLIEHISPLMGAVLALYVLFTSLALMNIVTGVFVETALQRGREEKNVYMINQLRELFGVLDNNGNGTIAWTEVQENLDDPKLQAFFKDIDLDISEARGLFLLLDRDASGWIDADEFLSGCLRLRGPAKSLDMQLVMRELSDQRKAMHKLLGSLYKGEDAAMNKNEASLTQYIEKRTRQ